MSSLIKPVTWHRGGYPEGDNWPFGDASVSPAGRYLGFCGLYWSVVYRDEWYMVMQYTFDPPTAEEMTNAD